MEGVYRVGKQRKRCYRKCRRTGNIRNMVEWKLAKAIPVKTFKISQER